MGAVCRRRLWRAVLPEARHVNTFTSPRTPFPHRFTSSASTSSSASSLATRPANNASPSQPSPTLLHSTIPPPPTPSLRPIPAPLILHPVSSPLTVPPHIPAVRRTLDRPSYVVIHGTASTRPTSSSARRHLPSLPCVVHAAMPPTSATTPPRSCSRAGRRTRWTAQCMPSVYGWPCTRRRWHTPAFPSRCARPSTSACATASPTAVHCSRAT